MPRSSFQVLLIEDSEDDYEAVRRELYLNTRGHAADFSIHWERTFAEGSVALRKNQVDVILLDLTLPDSNPQNGVQRIKSEFMDVPVVVLTGVDDEMLAIKMVEAGAQDYLVKGRHPGLLARTISYAVQRQDILRQLEKAERATRRAAQAKSAFFASMSHEIRNPLTSVIGYSEALMSSKLDERETNTALSAIFSNGRHLLQVINDVLDLSKIEAGELKIEMSREPLAPVLRELHQTFLGKAKEKKLQFEIEPRYPLPLQFESDAFRLKQILVNLVSNAIKFTKEGFVKLSVFIDKEKTSLIFEVKDSGVGISAESKQSLFKAFSQGEASRARVYGGTGLGLVISNQLAERLGGSIDFQSREGIGTTFTVKIPLGEIGKSSLTDDKIQVEPEQIVNTADELMRISGKILVADDMEDNRNLLSLVLKKVGLEVDTAENGRVALEMAALNAYDLIFLDMQMPEVDGYEVARTLRARGATQPVISITASVMEDSLATCLEAGCDACLRKPFRREELLDCVLQFLAKDRKGPKAVQGSVRDDELDEVRKAFLRKLPNQLNEIEGALAKNDLNSLRAAAHRIIGAGLFGYQELSHFGGVLESLIIQEQQGGLTLVEAVVKRVRNEVGRIALVENSQGPDSKAASGGGGATILVVDDDGVTLKVVCRNLSVKGFTAAPARSMEDALSMCDEASFALLIVGLEMGKGLGTDVIEAVRKKLERNIPVIAMTSRLPSEIKDKVTKYNIQHLLLKPVSRDQLFEAIDSLLTASLRV